MLSKTRRHKATIAGKATIVGKARIVGRAIIGKTAGNKTAGKWVHGGLERLSYVRTGSQPTHSQLAHSQLAHSKLAHSQRAGSQPIGRQHLSADSPLQTRVATYLGCCTVFLSEFSRHEGGVSTNSLFHYVVIFVIHYSRLWYVVLSIDWFACGKRFGEVCLVVMCLLCLVSLCAWCDLFSVRHWCA